jgi:hypothetical protein
MAALSHEHVVPIYAVDEHRGLPYFAMEYVPGGTLQARLSQEGPLEVVATVRIAMQTALALGAAHDSGLVHRDIKPANILLDRGVERVRVADFGLARTASEASYTASGVLAGTPEFMSPEQVRGEACDGRSDLFSLGSVLYMMCTGHEPFRAENVYSVLQRIVHDEPRSIREQNPAVPAWLEQFVNRLMAKDRDKRFQSSTEVAEALERELAHLQNPALGPAPARPWMPRKYALVGMTTPARRRAALAVVATIAASIAITVGTWRAWDGAIPAKGDAVLEESADVDIVAPALPVAPIAPVAPSAPPPPLPALWDADGLAETREFANSLEASAFSGEPTPDYDPGPPKSPSYANGWRSFRRPRSYATTTPRVNHDAIINSQRQLWRPCCWRRWPSKLRSNASGRPSWPPRQRRRSRPRNKPSGSGTAAAQARAEAAAERVAARLRLLPNARRGGATSERHIAVQVGVPRTWPSMQQRANWLWAIRSLSARWHLRTQS